LEPAKCWPVLNLFELAAIGLLLQDLFPKPSGWKWPVLAVAVLNLLVPVLRHPLERNLPPSDTRLRQEANKMNYHRAKHGQALVLPSAKEHGALYTPMPDPEKRPFFKRFIPNSNFYGNIPLANFYGSTWPTQGAMNAVRYFQFGFPYEKGNLLDALGVDLLYLPESDMPSRFKKVEGDGSWSLWENPGSVGHYFFFKGIPRTATRKEAFEFFASDNADPREDLFLDQPPFSSPPRHAFVRQGPPRGSYNHYSFTGRSGGYLVVTQNAMPGWRAWVNGRPTAVQMANGIFQCVPIAEKMEVNHVIRLCYEPASFRFGLFLSLLACASLVVFLGFRRFRKTDS
jgi:hypothetical protein